MKLRNYKINRYSAYLSIMFLVLGACKKDGILPPPIQPAPLAATSGSLTRILNFGYDADLIINNRLLTNNIASTYLDVNSALGLPSTVAFPSGGLWRHSPGTFGQLPGGNPIALPDSVISNGTATVKIRYVRYILSGKNTLDSLTTVINTPSTVPQDVYYYLGKTDASYYSGFSKGFTATYSASTDVKPFGVQVATFPRDIVPPSNPQNFKIRVINLGSTAAGTNLTGNGGVTLCYGDGTPVGGNTTGVIPGTTGGYVEVPYGTYYFRLKNAQGLLLPEKYYIAPTTAAGAVTGELGVQPISNYFTYTYGGTNFLQMSTTVKGLLTTNMPFSRIKTYQPGGIYSIVISPRQFTPGTGTFPVVNPYYYNGFELVQDVTPPANYGYGKVQIVNALPGRATVQASIDGVNFPSLNYGADPGADSYMVFQQGSHTLTVRDGSNTVINQDFALQGENNYTIYLYENASGVPSTLFVNNDLAFSVYINASTAAATQLRQSGSFQDFYATHVVFLNLTADVPTVSFNRSATTTNTNSIWLNTVTPDVNNNNHYFAQGQYLGSNITYTPVASSAASNYYFINAFAVPLNYKGNLPATTGSAISTPFLASTADNKYFASYPAAMNYLPVGQSYIEHGVYTVALIGRSNPAAPSTQQLRFLVIKHIK
ncbi:DUF4397 domain-containing protein [Mucilaginibacter paludis]|uniref:DUF4397 domain-containing protein n=1 Tax=Mucilaginibacter paludis DSM 18603 TaxID=714943 RepID=H1Y9B3_9SPHI|nr:DUF4397 domain-containing protein [Mucilaginibacter paludis]EHQ29491.1 hypothetical protein Mucpa_5419 [Mucilaginibacter paludis DSM 18603]